MAMSNKVASDLTSGTGTSYAAVADQGEPRMSVPVIFGANLRRTREALGLARDLIAAQIGIDEGHMAKIEAGVPGQVNIDLIAKITKELGISYAQLLHDI